MKGLTVGAERLRTSSVAASSPSLPPRGGSRAHVCGRALESLQDDFARSINLSDHLCRRHRKFSAAPGHAGVQIAGARQHLADVDAPRVS